MSPSERKQKEIHREKELKALREELEEKLSEQLPAEEAVGARVGAAKFEEPAEVDEAQAKRVVEAILFATSKPVTVAEIKRSLKGYGASKIEGFVRELQAEYERDGRSFRINEIAGGYELSTQPEYAPWIVKLEIQKKAKQATQSALETLSILAYKQPVTRAEIEELRGVDVSGVVSTLLEKNLIKIVGRKEVPGRPYLYGTTDKFLEHFGLKSLNELPNISEIKSLVENSVRKEDLLRTEKMLPTDGAQTPEPAGTEAPAETPQIEANTEGRVEPS